MYKSKWREDKESQALATKVLGVILVVLFALGVIISGHFWGYPVNL